MSINQLYEISRRSFRAFDARMNAAGQNVANAGTEGYHRRRVALRTDTTVASGLYAPPSANAATGNGVSVASYERVRDGLLESAAAEAQTGQGAADEEVRVLSALEGALATGTAGALPEAMSTFSDGWARVADHPSDRGVRSALLSRTDTLTATFNGLDQSLGQLREETQQALATSVEGVNERLSEIAALNQTIRTAHSGGSPDLAAEDQRDALVKELSAYAPVRVRDDRAAGYTLTIKGMAVVQGDETSALEVAGPPGQARTEVHFGDTEVAFRPAAEGDGKVGAQLHILNETLPGMQARLDDLAAQVVEEVNTAHAGGFDQAGQPGGPFFDPAGTTARTIQRAVAAPDAVAAFAAPGQPGDSTPARRIADRAGQLQAGAVDLAASVGAEVERASARQASQAAVANHLDSMVRGVSGVSLDEEMTRLIEHQQSFAASARVLNTAQSVMDTLLSM